MAERNGFTRPGLGVLAEMFARRAFLRNGKYDVILTKYPKNIRRKSSIILQMLYMEFPVKAFWSYNTVGFALASSGTDGRNRLSLFKAGSIKLHIISP
ncbi:MAG: hypothetical protein MZV70_44125 [Desulfobacterales bacterium]|nr:hypothetical protein [Desulfobacterales bacterium]